MFLRVTKILASSEFSPWWLKRGFLMAIGVSVLVGRESLEHSWLEGRVWKDEGWV